MARPLHSSSVLQVEALARTQLGLFTTDTAARCGVSDKLLSHHSRPGGRWTRLYPRVYALAFLPADGRRQLLAALIWGGRGAVLSHHTAAAIHGLDGIHDGLPQLWTSRWHSASGLAAHHGAVPTADVVQRRSLRVTSLRRTVIDLAAVVDDDTLELVVESAFRRDRHLEFDHMARTSGAARLRRVLARRPPGAPPTESELETRYLQLIRGAGLPPPVRQHTVFDEGGRCVGRLDVCWPEVGLWVELDGRATHTRAPALLSDRHRQNQLADRLQWLPLRFTWDDVVSRPRRTARFTEQAYARRRAQAERTVAPDFSWDSRPRLTSGGEPSVTDFRRRGPSPADFS